MALFLLGLRVIWLLRATLGDKNTIFVSGIYSLLSLVPFLVVGHLWHSSMSESIVLYALLTTFVLIRVHNWKRGQRAEIFVHLALAESLLLLAKPNTAMAALVFCLVAQMVARVRFWKILAAILVALVVDSLALRQVHTSLLATVHVYSQLTSRFLPVEFVEGLFLNPNVVGGLSSLAVYAVVLPPLWLLLRETLRDPLALKENAVLVLALGASAVTLIGFGTNVEFKLVDASALMLGFTLWCLSLRVEGAPVGGWFNLWRPGISYMTVVFFLFSVFLSASRARMQNVGEWGGDACGIPAEIDHADTFFGDFYNCRAFFSVLAESDAALAAHPGKRIFFGPRMEFLYARDGLHSPRGLPMWWHPGSSYPESSEAEVERTWEDNHFDELLFLHRDRTRLPKAILAKIEREYVLAEPQSLQGFWEEREEMDAHVDLYVRR
jgi:hypothetical protein